MNLKRIVIKIFLGYLRIATKLQLLKNRPKIIGITGSAGKTSTREAIYAGLKDLKIVKNCADGNSETGIPLNILGIKVVNYSFYDWLRILLLVPVKLICNWERFDFLIVEMGIDSPFYPKNMSYLLKILKPDLGIFLNVSNVHAETFDTLMKDLEPGSKKYEEEIKRLIANEKGKLIKSLSRHGYAILNGTQICQANLGKSIWFWTNKIFKTDNFD